MPYAEYVDHTKSFTHRLLNSLDDWHTQILHATGPKFSQSWSIENANLLPTLFV